MKETTLTNSDELIKFLTAYRKENHISQSFLADHSVLTQAQISKCERLKRLPTIDSLISWINALGLTITIKESELND